MAIGAGRGQYLSPEEYARLRRQGMTPGALSTMNQLAPNQPAILAGAGRGVLNPPLVNPDAPRPSMAGAVVPEKDEAGFEALISRAMAPETQESQEVPKDEAGFESLISRLSQPQASPMTLAMQPKDQGGFLSRLMAGRGDANAIYDGAIQAGVGLLSNTADPAKAMAAGFKGFDAGYDAKIAEERALKTPKITPIANGAAAIVQYPDGKYEVKPIQEVQEFLLGMESLQQLPSLQKQAQAQQEKSRAISSNYRNTVDATDALARTIKETKGQISGWSAGPIGQATAWLGGTPAAQLESSLKTIKANLGFNQLQQMRDSSPTGGALGQVAVEELKFLQSVEAALEQKLMPSQLNKKLEEVESRLSTRQQRLRQAYDEDVRRGLIPRGTVPELEGDGKTPAPVSGGANVRTADDPSGYYNKYGQ